jgi:hypothetical protein
MHPLEIGPGGSNRRHGTAFVKYPAVGDAKRATASPKMHPIGSIDEVANLAERTCEPTRVAHDNTPSTVGVA